MTVQPHEVGAAAVAVRDLTHVFEGSGGSVTALADVSLAIRPGEFCALIGPSGCGKTTLLHILAGLLVPTRGSVTVPPRVNGRLPIALVFQGISTFPWFTVLENVEYGLRILGTARPQARERARGLLAQVGMRGFPDAYPHQLSEGMRQRVSLARALAVDPDVLLMDEPFANLDEQNRLLLQDELLRLWQSDRKTVLFVTHSLDEAIRLADRVLVMTARPGRIKSEVVVPFARPRDFREIRRDPAYGALSARLWDELRDEVVLAGGA
ncbi:MAG TPA: ABC transporter ATP-binding protein [bacterium]|nr:ABC transporter ATP-binding protein [bacterium]